MAAESLDLEQPPKERKRGLLSRFRRSKPKGPPTQVAIPTTTSQEVKSPAVVEPEPGEEPVVEDKRDTTPSPSLTDKRDAAGTPPLTNATGDEEGNQENMQPSSLGSLSTVELPKAPTDPEPRVVTPINTKSSEEFSKGSGSLKSNRLPFRSEVTIDSAPTAREAAFGGPPRYDWIDIETSAAIKVQSVFRRNRAMKELEEEGLSTSAMRNRSRRRNARFSRKGTQDIPSLFRCCGVGLAFGDATGEEDEEAERARAKEAFEHRRKAREAKEAQLRENYRKVHGKKSHDDNKSALEGYEVVEDDETEDEEYELKEV